MAFTIYIRISYWNFGAVVTFNNKDKLKEKKYAIIRKIERFSNSNY